MDMDIVAIGAFSAFFSFIFVFIGMYLAMWGYERRINALERELDSLNMSIRGQQSGVAKREKAERQEMAMAEAFAIFNSKDEKLNKDEALKGLLLKYPDVALSLTKKFGIL